MANQNTYDIDELKKVVVGDSSKGGKGKSGGPAPDVEFIDTAEGGEEGQEGQEGQESQEGQEGQPGQPGQGQGSGSGEYSGEDLDSEEVMKRANDFLNDLNSNKTGKPSCGSELPRQKENANSTEDADRRTDNARKAISDIWKAIEEAEKNGVPNNFGSFKGRGSGGEKTASDVEYIPVPLQKPRPKFLDYIVTFAKKGYKKSYTKKGTDWLYTEAFDYDIFFKDRPKVAKPDKYLYVLVDCSGSMLSDFRGDGLSLFEHLIAYLPVLAKEFEGEVWWISDGIIHFKEDAFQGLSSPHKISVEEVKKSGNDKVKGGFLGISDLAAFKDINKKDREKIYTDIKDAYGFGGGTTFATEFQTVINIREAEGVDAAIVVLTDSEIDRPNLTFTWKGKKEKGHLPPNTIIMTNSVGEDYLKKNFKEDLASDRKIEIYDITDDGRYKFKKKQQ